MVRLLRRTPFTAALVVILIVVAAFAGPLAGPSKVLREIVGIDLESLSRAEWWSFLTADFFVDNLGQLLLVLAAAVVCVGMAERLIGTARASAAFLVTGALGFAAGAAVQAIGFAVNEYWAVSVHGVVTIDPLTPIVGTLAVASAWASTLWRRRIRTVTLAATLVFLLYSGQPSDLDRVIAVLIGFALGSLFSRRGSAKPASGRSSAREVRVLLASATVAFAVGPVITLLSHGRLGVLSPLGMFVADGLPHGGGTGGCAPWTPGHDCISTLRHLGVPAFSVLVLAVVPLVVLLVAARGLLNGRRAAVYLVAAFAAADGLLAAFYFGVVPVLGQSSRLATHASHVAEFQIWTVADIVIPLLFAALMIASRRYFPILAERRARRRAVATVLISFVTLSSGYLVIAWLARAQFRPQVDILDLLVDLPQRFIPLAYLLAERRDFVPIGAIARIASGAVGPLFWIVLLAASAVLLGSVRRSVSAAGDPARVRALIRRGAGSMSFPATWAGNSYWFDAGHDSVVAYRVANGCAITLGEPIGDPAHARAALEGFIAFCDARAWTPVFYSIHEEWAQALRERGWSTMTVAEETVIDVPEWSLVGKKVQDVRSSVNRAAREGLQVQWSTWSALPLRVTSQIVEISEAWVVDKSLPEMGFTLGGLAELADPDVLVGVVTDSSGAVQAVTSWMPSWRDETVIGYTLDFMRRRTDSMNGVMEYLIAEAVLRAQTLGLEFISLSGAPLAVTESGDATRAPLDRVLATLRTALEPVYGFSSLLAFKKKFRPRLVPLSMAYEDVLALPAIGIALSRCYLPNLGFRGSARLARVLRGHRRPRAAQAPQSS